MRVIAVDPGNKESAFVILEVRGDGQYLILEKGKLLNNELRDIIKKTDANVHFAIEMVASYGMAVGESIFDTVFWIGRFYECSNSYVKTRIKRKDVKMHICNSMRAKDSNIRQALIDKYGIVGTKKNPGFFYGFKDDIWSAFAVGITYAETLYCPF